MESFPFSRNDIDGLIVYSNSRNILVGGKMFSISTNHLNKLESKIFQTLKEYSQSNERFTIDTASNLCNCSPSKISKFVRKLGFSSFKDYLDFLYGSEKKQQYDLKELNRISDFITNFKPDLVDSFFEILLNYEKLILFGYGPSFECAKYFEYRLRIISNKVVLSSSDESFIDLMADESTLLIILSTTGSFRSFENAYKLAKNKGANVVIINEEYNPKLFEQCDRVFWMTDNNQPEHLKAYEKTRTTFFIFLEEVIQKFVSQQYSSNASE